MSRLMTMALTAAILAGSTPAEAAPYERRRDQPKDINPLPRKRAPRRYYPGQAERLDRDNLARIDAAEAKRQRRRERNRRTR